ncbi:hypothetical protein PIB30_082401 [Stylosanthes scabra]|uniref:Formin-like protein n=1 Tax=Stylosanthes scabra TaxID=79078 RepID=A0ABU6VQH7_9FABA|nr:hypothetical protein [Stylosanthes scabra]
MALKNAVILLSLLFLSHIFLLIQTCYSQTNFDSQNIETFYPIETPQEPPLPTINPEESPPSPSPSPSSSSSRNSSSNSKVAKAVAATAVGTLTVCGIVFFLGLMCFRAKKKHDITNTATTTTTTSATHRDHRNVVVPLPQTQSQVSVYERMEGNIKGLIVDENGLDVVYWKSLQDGGKNSKEVLGNNSHKNKEEKDHEEYYYQRKKSESNVQEIPLLRGLSSSTSSHLNIFPVEPYTIMKIPPPAPPPPINGDHKLDFVSNSEAKPPSISSSSTPTPLSPSTPRIQDRKSSAPAQPQPPPPPPPPISKSQAVPPRPPAPVPERKSQAPPPPPPPPPPPITVRKSQAPPPPPPPIPSRKGLPPKGVNLKSSSKPPPTPIEAPSNSKRGKSKDEVMHETGNGQAKLKPLHWDKVSTNLDHSMVWDKIDRGSFRVDDDLIEALFGYVAVNRDDPKVNDSGSSNKGSSTSAPSTIAYTLLDPRKSQNTAIVLKSLAISRKEVIGALLDGHGLNTDTIEKLSRVAPTEEEQSLILQYRGDPSNLPAAESFLYHTLKVVPSAFKRLNAMLFRLNYDAEIVEIKEFLQTLELGCKELRNQGVFLKLLEAVLKAGNRLNAGTHRGNAHAFNLTSLRKLSDVKSTDGKTTLLHFVVEEVVRSEGKRAALNRSYSMSRSSSRSRSSGSNSSENTENFVSDEQRKREYTTLGLPIVGGVSSEFSNVKKATLTDYKSFVGSISALSARIAEIRELVSKCGRTDKGGNFVREMNHFLAHAEEEVKLVSEEHGRVMQLVKKTTAYYQGGGTWKESEQPLQLFEIVKDFLGMVDQACIEIARNMQKRKGTKERGLLWF